MFAGFLEYTLREFQISDTETMELKDNAEMIERALKVGYMDYFTREEVVRPPRSVEKYLLNYEKKTKNLDGYYLKKAFYIPVCEKLEFWITPSRQWLYEQVTVWRFPEDIVNELNRGFFNISDIIAKHGGQRIGVLEQEQVDSFDIKEPVRRYMKIEDFYQQDNDRLFAVNIDMDKWKQELVRLQDYMPHSIKADDGLAFMRQQTLGVNVPQMYIKQKGSYTGGHQENGAVNALNYNHGPADCLWLTVDSKQVRKLLQLVPNLYEIEGLWWKGPEFFIENQIEIKYTIQKKGDLIILGPGCLHWVKALGVTVNTAWNYLTLHETSYQEMFARQLINAEKKIKIIVPIKSLMFDIYIHTKQDTNQLRVYLREFYVQEWKNIKGKVVVNQYARNVLLCSKCDQEIFVFFTKDRSDISNFLCMECSSQHTKVYAKYKPTLMDTILYIDCPVSACSTEYCSIYHSSENTCTVQELLKLPPIVKVKTQRKTRATIIVSKVQKEESSREPSPIIDTRTKTRYSTRSKQSEEPIQTKIQNVTPKETKKAANPQKQRLSEEQFKEIMGIVEVAQPILMKKSDIQN